MISFTLLMGLGKNKVHVAVITRALWLGDPPPTKHMAELSTPSVGSPKFVQLNNVLYSAMQNAINESPFDKLSTEALPLVEYNEDEDDNDLYQFVDTLDNKSNGHLKPKPRPTRAFK